MGLGYGVWRGRWSAELKAGVREDWVMGVTEGTEGVGRRGGVLFKLRSRTGSTNPSSLLLVLRIVFGFLA